MQSVGCIFWNHSLLRYCTIKQDFLSISQYIFALSKTSGFKIPAHTQKYSKPYLLCQDSFFIHFKFVLDAILFLNISRDTWVPGEKGEDKVKANK